MISRRTGRWCCGKCRFRRYLKCPTQLRFWHLTDGQNSTFICNNEGSVLSVGALIPMAPGVVRYFYYSFSRWYIVRNCGGRISSCHALRKRVWVCPSYAGALVLHIIHRGSVYKRNWVRDYIQKYNLKFYSASRFGWKITHTRTFYTSSCNWICNTLTVISVCVSS